MNRPDRTRATTPPALAALRAELDGIDDAMHDLLMRRAAIVQAVARQKQHENTGATLRPGREAAILRRLLARHHGALPQATLVRIWREVLAGALALQGELRVAAPQALCDLARAQYGLLAPLAATQDAAAALHAVRQGQAGAAVLPLPGGADGAWWVQLLAPDCRLHVIARLPFWPAGGAEALVVAGFEADESGDDIVVRAWRPPGPAGSRPGCAEEAGWVLGLDGQAPPADTTPRVLGRYARPAVPPDHEEHAA